MRTEEQKKRDMLRTQRKEARMKILRRRRRLLIGAIVAVIAAVILLVLALRGTFYKKADTTTLKLNSDGSVVFEEVTKLSENYYDASDLKSFIKSTIKEYNDENGSGSVKLKYFTSSVDQVYCRTTYKSVDVYEDFTSYYAYAGTISDATDSEGLDFNDSFVSVSSGKKGDTAKVSKVTETGDNNVLVLEENCTVVVPGNILYVTDKGTTVSDDDTVVISASDTDDDAVVRTYIVYK